MTGPGEDAADDPSTTDGAVRDDGATLPEGTEADGDNSGRDGGDGDGDSSSPDRVVGGVRVGGEPPAAGPLGDTIRTYEMLLEPGDEPPDHLLIPKYVVPTLPDRFERTYLAAKPTDAIASYRDMDARLESAHVHEYPGHWELHVDRFNPHYYPVEHVVADTAVSSVVGGTGRDLLVAFLRTVDRTGETVSTVTRTGALGLGRVLREPGATGFRIGLALLSGGDSDSGG